MSELFSARCDAPPFQISPDVKDRLQIEPALKNGQRRSKGNAAR